MVRYGMVIDLRRCVGCGTCTIACKLENFIPPDVKWTRIHDYEIGEYPRVVRRLVPTGCMHCEDPPCVKVCPTKATIKRDDGIVYVDYEKCMGCGSCIEACPYRARTVFNGRKSYYASPTQYEDFPYEARAPHQRFKKGTTTKCTFCMHRIDEAVKRGLKPGVDPEATPACVNACLTNARHFGDLDDPYSEVSRLILERAGFRLLEELGTRPSVYYLR